MSKRLRILELFSGTKSVTKAFPTEDIISLDILDKHKPSIVCDIMNWDYKQYEPGTFDIIWASPPCVEYSIIKNNTKMPTDLTLSDAMVKRTLEIIEYLKPTKWFIENPQTSLLKKRPFMNDIPFYDVDYCRFSNWGYRKRTRIWTNVKYENMLCLKEGKCPNMTGRFHKASFGGQGRPKEYIYIKVPAGENAHRVPTDLIVALFNSPVNI
jgi:site-specific DNA-cytosine methylase